MCTNLQSQGYQKVLSPLAEDKIVKQGKRKCHDCGKPTPDYRCPACLEKWRLKNGVPMKSVVSDDVVGIYW